MLSTSNQFDITLDSNGSGVFRLVAPTNLGDFDVDLDVDGADFLAWQRGGSPGDLAGDLAAWESAFGTGYSSLAAAGAVPEPSTAALLSLALAGLATSGRRRR